ncbi:hypothetical protein D3C75_1107430 [compost metagenome]
MKLLLAPNKDGSVSVYQDGDFVATYSIKYADAKNGTVPDPEPPVQHTPEPTQAPTEPPPASADPTIEPEILPPSTEEGTTTGSVNQTGFVAGNADNGQTTDVNDQGKGNGKEKGKNKDK